MLRKLVTILAVLVVLLLVLIATRPDTYTVERSTSIDAPPAVVYRLVSDFHSWDRWSPWATLDPSMKTTYGGAPAGVGATYAWAGNDKVGSGKMTIADAKPDEAVGIDLEFLEPMASTSRTDFLFRADGSQTRVVWRMTGHNNFMGKAFTMVMNMDQLIGKDFETGLSQLRSAAETDARAAAAATEAAAPPADAPGDVPGSPADAGAP